MLALDQILNETIWVVKMNGYRLSGTYEEMKHYSESEECRDFDIAAEQPEHLKDFYDMYFNHKGFITIQEFYEEYYKPARKEKARRVWTEEEIKTLVQKNDKVLYGALKKLYACQTEDEKEDGAANHKNGAGFNGVDAGILTSFCEFLNKAGFLTEKQKVIARKKMVKYTKQLTILANI